MQTAGAKREEGRDLVEVVGEGVLGAAELVDAVDLEHGAAAAGDARAHRGEKRAELLHMRLGGRVDEARAAARQGRAQHEVLGRRDRGVVGPVIGGHQAPMAAYGERAAPALDLGAEGEEDVDVRIDLARAERAAGDVVVEPGAPEAREEGRHQHDRRAHAARQAHAVVADAVAVAQPQDAGREIDVDVGAELTEEVEELPHVGDVGHAPQHDRFGRQQRRAEDRQHRVLVGRGRDDSAQRATAVHDQMAHGRKTGSGGAQPVLPATANPR